VQRACCCAGVSRKTVRAAMNGFRSFNPDRASVAGRMTEHSEHCGAKVMPTSITSRFNFDCKQQLGSATQQVATLAADP